MAELSTLARPYARAAFDFANEQSTLSQWNDFLFIASTIVSDASFKAIIDNPAITPNMRVEALIDIYDNQVAIEGESPFKALLVLNNDQYNSASVIVNDSASTNASVSVAKVSEPIKNFILQLAEQERLSLLPQVFDQFRLLRSKVLKQVDAYVTSAYPMDDAQRSMIKSQLEKAFNANVVLHEDVDASLIGGATIKVGDKVVDDSIKGKLKQLKTQLTA